MDEHRFQGWTNYKTWIIFRTLIEEQATYDRWRRRAASYCGYRPNPQQLRLSGLTAGEYLRLDLADELHESFKERSPLPEHDFYSHLIDEALDDVDWERIAEFFLSDAA